MAFLKLILIHDLGGIVLTNHLDQIFYIEHYVLFCVCVSFPVSSIVSTTSSFYLSLWVCAELGFFYGFGGFLNGLGSNGYRERSCL